MQREGLTNALIVSKLVLILTLAFAVILGTWIGYRWWSDHSAVVDNGRVRAQVVEATLFARNDLRVGRLSGKVQGVGQTSRFWGWLPSSQVVRAPFTVDYFIGLQKLDSSDIVMSRDGRHLRVNAPDVYVDRPNVDLANTTVNNAYGLFITRGAMAEMAGKAAGSAQAVALERARSPENIAKTREFARRALKRLFEGALRAAKVNAEVEVRFSGDPVSSDGGRWDMSRTIEEVLADPKSRS